MPLTTPHLRLISMEVTTSGRCDCYFRILANRSVKYITVKAKALDAESLDDMPLDFETILPPLPWQDDSWNSATITRDLSSSDLTASISKIDLPGVQTIWHPLMIEHVDLERTEYLTLLTQECKLNADVPALPERMISKMARFDWEVQYMEAETRMYKILDSEGKDIAPKFLGHVHEAGRVMGFVLEKIPDGRNAEPADLEVCEAALRRFHALGYVHGDCNKYNFIICPDGRVVLIDFDKARPCDDQAVMEAEVASLRDQLAETTGRGGGLMAYDGHDSDHESGGET